MDEQAPGEVRHPLLPQLRFDELLDELMSRVEQIRASRDRVQQLLQGVLAVSGGLELDQVLTTIITTAAELVDARYGALGVIGGDRSDRLERFVTVGLTPEEIAEIGPYPTGHGLLGQLIRHPVPLRLEDISAHEASFGFPDNHPPMNSFLGVPIRVRDEVYGNLYLTEKRNSALFDADDEALLVTLAAAAGVAIDNARLYDDAQRRQRWMEATAELTRGLLSGVGATEVLTVLVDRVRGMADADSVIVLLPDTERSSLTAEVAQGIGADRLKGATIPMDGSVSGQVFQTAAGQSVPDDASGANPVYREAGLGASYVAPMGGEPGRVRGVLVVARRSGAMPFDSQVVRMINDVAAQAAVGLELAARRADADKLALFADRDRIGRDLHDLAIQRLFATGMTLQSVLKITEKAAVRERVTYAVADLDDTIKVIRSTIFALQEHETAGQPQGLRTQVLRVCQDSTELLGFAPAVRFTGPVDYEAPEQSVEHAVAVVREALSNVARHAGASQVAVDLETGNGVLSLRIADDGAGLPDGGRRSGLANLADRAAALGGTFTAGPGEPGGTVLLWQVPLD
jgi:signal transduction histidine kinase